MFILQHFVFGAAGTAALLAADFFPLLLFLCLPFQDLSLKEIQEPTASQITVDGLRTIVLAFDEEASRTM